MMWGLDCDNCLVFGLGGFIVDLENTESCINSWWSYIVHFMDALSKKEL